MKIRLGMLFGLLLAFQCMAAGDVEYRTGGSAFTKTWYRFYVVMDHEPEIAGPLIARGRVMVPAICEAIQHKDMKRRRYAISALGYIGDKRAVPTLEAILDDRSELDYFRGDALQSIYRIDRTLGLHYANQYRHENDYLTMLSNAIIKHEPWLLEKREEE